MPNPELISSPANPLVKSVRKAVSRSGLTADGLCVAESLHLLTEALRSEIAIPAVLVAESALASVEHLLPNNPETRVVTLPDDLFGTLTTTEATQGLISLLRLPDWSPDLLFNPPALVVILDGIQDPGNAGAIVRAAEAFGATGVIFGKGTVSPHNPRTLRASAGSLFRLPHVSGLGPTEVTALLTEHQCRIFAAMPSADPEQTAERSDLTAATALIVGSEGHGISQAYFEVSRPVTIPTQHVESLNAAVAAAILLYEASRQRQK